MFSTLKPYLRSVGYVRWSRMLVTIVFVWSLFIPLLMQISEAQAYVLSPEVNKVLGTANKNLSAKFSLDTAGDKWQFNKNGIASLASSIAKQQKVQDSEEVAGALSQITAKQVGGAGKNDPSLYSVDLPVKAENGITYYDNVTRLSFKMIPTFSSLDGKLIDGRIVYPFGSGAKIVYTAKSNGLKEDIVLEKYIGETLRYEYKLELPDSLEARLLDDGSIGVYSANPALYGNISYSSDEDRARVMEGRKEGIKNHMVFGIPAPFIKDQKGKAGQTKYELHGNKLTVVASGLKDLSYPLAVDPSVTVTSSSDFENGNNEGEGNITFADGEIRRGTVSGGTAGTWASADTGSAFTPTRAGHNSVAYNGYMYVIGGADGGGGSTDVSYAAICTGSNTNGGCTGATAGKVGTWTVGGSLVEGRGDNGMVAYNGYLYTIGGQVGGSNISSMVQRSQIGANGAPGTWSNIGSFPTNIVHHEAVAYDGRLYVAGGCTALSSALCSDFNGNVYTATINGDGSLSPWTQLTGTPLTTARYGHTTFAYNGYLYVAGGCTAKDIVNNCSSTTTSVEYAKINSDGTLGSWAANTSMSTARRGLVSAIHNGYIYLSGEDGISNYIQYAPIHSSGVIGTWSSTTAYTTAKKNFAMASYNGYLYITGGCTSDTTNCNLGAGYTNVTEYVKIDTAGATTSYTASTNYDSTARATFATVVYNNFIYVIGGTTSNAGGKNDMLSTTRYASISSDGTIGTWATASANFANTNSGAGGQTCGTGCPGRVNMGAAATNGYLYIAGGTSNGSADMWSDVQSAVICTGLNAPVSGCAAAGDLRNWTTRFTDFLTNSTTTYTEANGRSHVAMQIYNGKMYLIGGNHLTAGGGADPDSHIYSATINTNGSVGNFTLSSVSLPSARAGLRTFVHDERLYIVGGGNGATWAGIGQDSTDVHFIPLNSDGTLDGVTGWKDADAVGNGGSGTKHSETNARNSYGVVMHNAQVYVIGGVDSTSNTTTTVKRASINANGSLSPWTSAADLPSSRFGSGTVAVNGRVYVLGGCQVRSILIGQNCSSIANMLNDAQSARVNNGGSGNISGWTTDGGTSFSTARWLTASVTYNNYIYLIGGTDSVGARSDVQYAPLNSDGSVGAWAATTNFDINMGRPAAVVYGGYLYATHGTDVRYALICTGTNNGVGGCGSTQGTLGTWNTGSSLNASHIYHSVIAKGGYLYVMGDATAGSAAVEYAQINPTNGSLGVWSNTTALPVAGFARAVVAGSYVFATGFNGSDIISAPINSNGTLGAWKYVRQLPSPGGPASTSMIVVQDGYLYVYGGYGGSNFVSTVVYAPITNNGTLGRWERATSMNTARMSAGYAAHNGYIYALGGCSAGGFNVCTSYQNSVEYAAPQTIARKGLYSKLLTVNPTTDIAGVYYNGSLGGGSSVQYKVAPSTGVFGETLPATQGSGAEPTPLCGAGAIYYIQVYVTLNDTTNAIFGDLSSSNVTDITTYYRLNATPPPNLRMHGGKWFYSETQQPLDLCKA